MVHGRRWNSGLEGGKECYISIDFFLSFFKNAIYDRWAIEIEGSQVNRACRWTGGIAMKMVVGMAAVCDY